MIINLEKIAKQIVIARNSNNNNNNIIINIIDVKTELAELYNIIQFEEYNKAKILLMESISKNGQTFHELKSNIKILRLFDDLYETAKRWNDRYKIIINSNMDISTKIIIITKFIR